MIKILQKARDWYISDARHYQLSFLLIFLLTGLIELKWSLLPYQIPLTFGIAILTQAAGILVSGAPWHSMKSALITSFSLSILFRSDDYRVIALAALIAIGSKFILRTHNKHYFNPANIGICMAILLTSKGWISPGQWGSEGIWLFLVGILGFMVVTRAKRLELALFFILAYGGAMAWRVLIWQNWPADALLHTFSNGALLLFTFFMITDPVSTPAHRYVRIFWAAGTGFLAFWLQAYQWVNGSPLWALFIFSFLTPLLDRLFPAERFQWNSSANSSSSSPEKSGITAVIRNTLLKSQTMKRATLIIALLILVQVKAMAFCGFYVAKSDLKLFNKTSQVILVRNGEQTTVTMSSDYQGEARDFAMVIPVPVVLKERDIKVVDRRIFDLLDAYSAPRLVEYFDASPCGYSMREVTATAAMSKMAEEASDNDLSERKKDYKVAVLARYTVGEYDIQILNALESGGLERWLADHGYKIPEGAKEVLEPYIKSNMKFFVVKVNLDELSRNGSQLLRPLQISFNSPKFMLPIRLGMANGEGNQDMIIYAFTRQGRIESTNYRTLKMPSDRNVPTFVKDNFAQFYADLYRKNLRREGYDNLYLEYAWDLSGQNAVKCDPCPSQPPLFNEMVEAGVNWLQTGGWGGYTGPLFFTRLHVTYNRKDYPQDLIFQETPNREQFQCRYILNHPAAYTVDCPAWNQYQQQKTEKRYQELRELAALTGWDVSIYNDYPYSFHGYRAPKPAPVKTGYHPVNDSIKPTGPDQAQLRPELPNTSRGKGTDNKLSDSLYENTGAEVAGGFSQEAFLPNESEAQRSDPQEEGKKTAPFGMIALCALAGLYLLQRVKV